MANLDDVESENNKSSNSLPSIPEDDDPNTGYISDHVASNKNFYE